MNDDRLTRFALIASGLFALLFFALSGYTLYTARWYDSPSESAEVMLSAPLSVGQAAGTIRISTAERGIVAIEERSIEGLQLPFVSFSADSLRLSKEGEPIAFYI
ncbi:MAG: hypothetical protein ACPG8W_15720, partial [Candidatus Promineifilaceae bacterium]